MQIDEARENVVKMFMCVAAQMHKGGDSCLRAALLVLEQEDGLLNDRFCIVGTHISDQKTHRTIVNKTSV